MGSVHRCMVMDEKAAGLGHVQSVLDSKLTEMKESVKKLRDELNAKEAVLEEVLRSANRIPRHPCNTACIANVLNSRIKQADNVLKGFHCETAWKILFQEHICLAVDVTNDTSQTVLPVSAAFCNRDVSDTVVVAFDGFKASQYIPYVFFLVFIVYAYV
ncbi:unnamed protein product [Gongylonema pulchrum]|uniref:Uncharacterized protein n=1 Tax=Gongylonema pulchrum TaxID=637853 RepID=A0A3P7NFL1_9BILA|nr:unnamed protein product [Gongylonema pulchrum]